MQRSRWLLTFALCLPACGSGASDSETDTFGDPDAGMNGEAGEDGAEGGEGAGETQVPDNAYCSGVADWQAAWIDFENEVVTLTNQARATGATCGNESMPPVGALDMVPELLCAARVHSQDMSQRGYFSHDTPEGVSPFERMSMAGYEFSTAGENIAAGYPTPQDVVQGWLDSPGHCTNIMNGAYTDIGVGFHGEGNLWTQVFGTPR